MVDTREGQRKAILDGLDPQGSGQMALAYPGRTQQQKVLLAVDEFTGGQQVELALVGSVLEGKVEAVQGFADGQT